MPTFAQRRTGAAVALLTLGVLAVPAVAGAALRATDIDMRGRAASERIVISFSGGALTGLERQVDTPDPAPGDGRASVRINAARITSTAGPASRGGVSVRIVRRAGSIIAVIDASKGRFKFVSYHVAGMRNRLVIDLWRATTNRAAAIRSDGCLKLTAWRGGTSPAVRGLELRPLFEHTVVTSLRAQNAGGATLVLRPRTATGFRFRPDFSGYTRPGRFAGPLPHSVSAPQRVMLEAWSTSAKDGSLECLVQTPVTLRP